MQNGTFQIHVTFIQPSSKLLNIALKCSKVTIVGEMVSDQETCFPKQDFHLYTSNAANNITGSSSVLQLFHNLPYALKPSINTRCSLEDFLYAFYLLHVDPSQWKYPRSQRYSSLAHSTYHETFLADHCSPLEPTPIFMLEERKLVPGCYLAVVTVSRAAVPGDFRQFIQPIEIIRPDLVTSFGGNLTIGKDDDTLVLNFYSTTVDPDSPESDRRKLNFTLLCYPAQAESMIFVPNTIHWGPSRPTEANPQNMNSWSIQWKHLNLVLRKPDLNLQFYEHSCLTSSRKESSFKKPNIDFDLHTKTLNISEDELAFDNNQLVFVLIVRHVIDGRQLTVRLQVEQEINLDFTTLDLNVLEDAVNNLEDLATTNPRKAVEFVAGLADKLNSMIDTNVDILDQ